MNSFSLTIPRAFVSAVSRFMAKDDVRYYLNGIHVEAWPNVAYLTATDGHTLCRARIERGSDAPFGQGSIIIPAEFVAKVKPSGNKGLALVLTVDGENFTINDAGVKTSGKGIDGRFPDVARVTPREVSGEAAFYNPEYLMRCQKASKDLGSELGYFSLGYNGTSAALVGFENPIVFALLMPMRGDPMKTRPEWAFENPEDVGRVLDVDQAHELALEENRIHDMVCGESLPIAA